MLTHALTVVAALLAAVFIAVGIVVRQRATIDVPTEDGVSTSMFATLLRRPLWWAGTACAVAGFGFQALALTHGSLILVQPLLVSALLFALPLSARLSGRQVTPAEWTWALLLTAALTVFVVVAHTRPGDYEVPLRSLAVSVLVCGGFVAACVLWAVRAPVAWRAGLLGVAVGVLFGAIAVLTKIVVHQGTVGGDNVLLMPAFWVLLGTGALAMLLQQSAFHAGALQASVPMMLVLEPVVAVVLGATVLGEHLRLDGAEPVVVVVAVAVMVAATVALGRGEGAYEARLEAAAEEHR